MGRSKKPSNVDKVENIQSSVSHAVRELKNHADAIDNHLLGMMDEMKNLRNSIDENAPARGYTFPPNHSDIDVAFSSVESVMTKMEKITPAIDEFIKASESFSKFYAQYMERVNG